MRASLRLLQVQDRPVAKGRGPRADAWLTVSAWFWALYFTAVAAGALWMIF
jgi:hypothetical protein